MVEYFAYGSNMNLDHLADWLRRFGVHEDEFSDPRRATLHGYRIRTNYLTTGRSGAANIEPSNGDVVEGVLLKITPAAQDALRAKEGWPGRYAEIEVLVAVPGRKRRVRAMTYAVTPVHRLAYDMPVSLTYRMLILDGAKARGLNHTYQMHLKKRLTTIDVNPADFLKSSHGAGKKTRRS